MVYDPTNLKNEFLSEDVIKKSARKVNENHNSCKEALDIIVEYENRRREEIIENLNANAALEWFNDKNLSYRNSHGDWIHHTSTYSDFYASVDTFNGEGK